MKQQALYIKCRRHRAHTGEDGIALIVTLSILSIILIIAVGFALSARTELKSSSSYNDMVAAESLAKMGMDRCLMEIAFQPPHQPSSGDTNNLNYYAEDLTQIDGSWNNDSGTTYPDGTRKGDFVNLDAAPQRASNEPYWIVVSNRTGRIVGRFAYVSSGALADLNAIGNISGPLDTYVRGNGYIGIETNTTFACTNSYTRGICSDVNMVAFLHQLGYGSPNTVAESARRILCFRYGWNPAAVPVLPLGAYKPGDNGINENGDAGGFGFIDDPQEYDPVQPKGCSADDQAVPSLDSLDFNAPPIAPDNAHSNLQDYATTLSSDPNLTNSFGIARLNLNAMTTASNVADIVTMLSQVPLGTSSISMNATQVALNLIDFHTRDRYPTVYQPAGRTNVYVGIKPTPYLNQILNSGTIVLASGSTNGSGDVAAKLVVNVVTGVEVWNPYSGTFPDPCNESVTNICSILLPTLIGTPLTNLVLVGASTITFSSPIAGGLGSFPVVQSNVISFSSAEFSTNGITWPLNGTYTNVFIWSDFSGLNTNNKINVIAGQALTNASLSFSGLDQKASVVINLEADDPRMNVLYRQTNDFPIGSQTYSLGVNNANTCSPILLSPLFADTGPREGLNSFYVKTNDYVTIGEIGYVHRGEPWATIRLQPNGTLTYGEGNILDYIRVNDLSEVRGRISINAETNGPLGALQSPLLYALFEGLTNSAGTILNDINFPFKIQAIISEIAIRRQTRGDFTGIGQLCGITTLTSDYAGIPISATSDAEREAIIRDVSNLITARSDSGVTEIIAWGQVIKGKPGNPVTGPVVQIRAKYSIDKVGHLIRITKFQYTRQ